MKYRKKESTVKSNFLFVIFMLVFCNNEILETGVENVLIIAS